MFDFLKRLFCKNTIKVDAIVDDQCLPMRMTPKAAGYDVYSSCNFLLKPGRNKVPIGIRIQFDKRYECQVEARSGFSLKGFEAYYPSDVNFERPVRIDADVLSGKGDADYTGEYGVLVKSYEDKPFVVKKGTRIAQITFVEVKTARWNIVDKLQETKRADGAHGSTGNH